SPCARARAWAPPRARSASAHCSGGWGAGARSPVRPHGSLSSLRKECAVTEPDPDSARATGDPGATSDTDDVAEPAEPAQDAADIAQPARLPREVYVLVGASFLIAIGYGIIGPALPNFAHSFD